MCVCVCVCVCVHVCVCACGGGGGGAHTHTHTHTHTQTILSTRHSRHSTEKLFLEYDSHYSMFKLFPPCYCTPLKFWCTPWKPSALPGIQLHPRILVCIYPLEFWCTPWNSGAPNDMNSGAVPPWNSGTPLEFPMHHHNSCTPWGHSPSTSTSLFCGFL